MGIFCLPWTIVISMFIYKVDFGVFVAVVQGDNS